MFDHVVHRKSEENTKRNYIVYVILSMPKRNAKFLTRGVGLVILASGTDL